MTTHLNKGCNASNHPYGKLKEPEVREYIIPTDDIIDEKSMSQLMFLVKEQRKRIKYLEAELEFFKEKAAQGVRFKDIIETQMDLGWLGGTDE